MPRSLGLVNRLLPLCMFLTPLLGEEQFHVPLPSVPVGGRLTQFLHHWEKFTSDVWVVIEIELLLTEDGTFPCLRSET
jgi:uncharacterized cupin superfamily protein